MAYGGENPALVRTLSQGPNLAVGRLDLGGEALCTGALIRTDLVLTAAHCLYDKDSGARIAPQDIEFLAGWHGGHASAIRTVRRAVHHPAFVFSPDVRTEYIRYDLALLLLQYPISNAEIVPFDVAGVPNNSKGIEIISYGNSDQIADAVHQSCALLGQQQGVILSTCQVNYGASGAPVLAQVNGAAHIVSVVSAKAEIEGRPVAMGSALGPQLRELMAIFERAPSPRAIGSRPKTGAKFVKP